VVTDVPAVHTPKCCEGGRERRGRTSERCRKAIGENRHDGERDRECRREEPEQQPGYRPTTGGRWHACPDSVDHSMRVALLVDEHLTDARERAAEPRNDAD